MEEEGGGGPTRLRKSSTSFCTPPKSCYLQCERGSSGRLHLWRHGDWLVFWRVGQEPLPPPPRPHVPRGQARAAAAAAAAAARLFSRHTCAPTAGSSPYGCVPPGSGSGPAACTRHTPASKEETSNVRVCLGGRRRHDERALRGRGPGAREAPGRAPTRTRAPLGDARARAERAMFACDTDLRNQG